MTDNSIFIEVPADIKKSFQEITDILVNIIDISTAMIMRYNPPQIKAIVSSSNNNKAKINNSGQYCKRVVQKEQMLLISDTRKEQKDDSTHIESAVISYLGLPIKISRGNILGTICLLDNKPNKFNGPVLPLIKKFGSLIEYQFEGLLDHTGDQFSGYSKELQLLRGMSAICYHCKSIKDRVDKWQTLEQYFFSAPALKLGHSICPACMQQLYLGSLK